MRKSELLVEVAKNIGIKGTINVPDGLWGYGKIKYDEGKCIGCSKCEVNCSEGAISFERIFDLPKIYEAEKSDGSLKKDRIVALIKSLTLKKPKNPINVPELVEGYGNVKIDLDKCIGCGNCQRYCTGKALKVEKILEIGGGN
ncbi:MAG: 4Fe-4S binding protein [bacterium]|nr:4Fe-4S binding protein [bacterium]